MRIGDYNAFTHSDWAEVVPQELAAAGTMMPLIEILFDMGVRLMVFTDVEEAFACLDGLEG